ncbi:Uncharacterized protein SCF082_LOCUS42900 [Durusdinium trenchii]|uniref:Uncharacterized protein n=1 Tax=Durusdinium trenchii TaxID=1381693 RepID=A0ABP0QRY0_9DINO
MANEIVEDVRAHPYWQSGQIDYYTDIEEVRPIPDQIVINGILFKFSEQQMSEKARLYGPKYFSTMSQILWERLNGNAPINVHVVDQPSSFIPQLRSMLSKGQTLRYTTYENFQGLDRSRDIRSLERREKQPLWELINAHCDWRGDIVRDGGASKVAMEQSNDALIEHVGFYQEGGVYWAESNGTFLSLNSDRGHKLTDIYPASANLSSTVFNRSAYVMSEGHMIRQYDGSRWTTNSSRSAPKPAFGVSVNRRMVVGGFPEQPTVVQVSRVDRGDIFPGDEPAASSDSLRAGTIDIKNLINTSSSITGLGAFEKDNLVIFTSDTGLLYRIGPDISEWGLQSNVNIEFGTISHNTIVNVQGQLLFCGRDGVHATLRSRENGIMVYSLPMSQKISELYRSYVRAMGNTQHIRACYDKDNYQYHIWFPINESYCPRLTLTFDPTENAQPKWSSGDFLGARAGAFLSGELVFGTRGGVYKIHSPDEVADVYPDAYIETPILWNGQLLDQKTSNTFLLQADGDTSVAMTFCDQDGRIIYNKTVRLSDGRTDDDREDPVLTQQNEFLFQQQYRGVRLKASITGPGIQYRVGNYTDSESGWVTVVTLDQITGPAGTNVGTIEGPLFYNRSDQTATASQTDFPYAIDDGGDDVLVYQNGLLLKETDYSVDTANDLVVLGSGATLNDIITIFTVRDQVVTNYRRQDTAITTTQSVVAFVHSADETFQVYKNGVLQRSGGTYDYVTDSATNTITFTSSLVNGDVVSVVTVENESLKSVTGLMLKEQYTDANGAIPYSKLSIANDDIPAAKVAGLATFLSTGAKVTVSGTTPSSPSSGNFWIDTSLSPNQLKFFDGTQWLNAAPESTLPSFTNANAGQLVRVNGTGTALEYGPLDLSSVVPKSYMAAANGVATLDASGRLFPAQLPTELATGNLYTTIVSPANGAVHLERRFGQKLRIEGISTVTSSGSINVSLTADTVTDFYTRLNQQGSDPDHRGQTLNVGAVEGLRDAANRAYFREQRGAFDSAKDRFSNISGSLENLVGQAQGASDKNDDLDSLISNLQSTLRDADSFSFTPNTSGYIRPTTLYGVTGGVGGNANSQYASGSDLFNSDTSAYSQNYGSLDYGSLANMYSQVLGHNVPVSLGTIDNPNNIKGVAFTPQYQDINADLNSLISEFGFESIALDDSLRSSVSSALESLYGLQADRRSASASQLADARTLENQLSDLSIEDFSQFGDLRTQIDTGLSTANEYGFTDVSDLYTAAQSTLDGLDTELGAYRTGLEESAAERLAALQDGTTFTSLDAINEALSAYDERAAEVETYGATDAQDELAAIKAILDDNFVRLDEERIIKEQDRAARQAVAQARYGQPGAVVNGGYATGTEFGDYPNWVRVRNRETGQIELIPANFLEGVV